MSPWIYYSLVVVLLASNSLGFLLNFASLPGNWLIVLGSGIFCWLVQTEQHSVSWYVVGLLALLAIVGEVLEMIAGMAGAARHGASRRAMALSVAGSMLGSICGAIIGMPIAIVGPAIAALIGGALGAAAGAIIGEDWKGRQLDDSMQVGAAAFYGRILGTIGKLGVGGIMVVIATLDSVW